MEYNRGRHNIGLQLTEKAIEKTNSDVLLVLQRINILEFQREFDQLRREVKRYLEIYDREGRQDEYLRLLRNWKNIEYNLFKERSVWPKHYFEAVEMLIEKESDIETKIELYKEALKI